MKGSISFEERRKIALDILRYINSICRQNNIQYSLFSGTALGAIRHGGFIPWDDDIDIALLAPDYERLTKILRNDDRYRLLLPENGKYNRFFAKLCDKNSHVSQDSYNDIEELGIWVDIFPLNNAGNDLEEAKKFAQLCKKREKKFVDFVGAKHYYQASKKSYEIIKRPLFFIPAQLYRAGWEQNKMRTLELMRSKNDRPMRYVSSNTVCAGCEVFEKDLFDHLVEVPFEDGSYLIVRDFDKFLNIKYGDYMTLPPEEERVPHHLGKYQWRESAVN